MCPAGIFHQQRCFNIRRRTQHVNGQDRLIIFALQTKAVGIYIDQYRFKPAFSMEKREVDQPTAGTATSVPLAI